MSEGAERRAVVALVAVFALLVQALVPALAAASPLQASAQVICTGHGLKTVPPGDTAPMKQSPGGACDHCVCIPLAAAPAPVSFAIRSPSYALAVTPEAIWSDLPPPARAPPRPPGQGPPG
jgi:hypothetical protein